jgi:alpha-glucosidase
MLVRMKTVEVYKTEILPKGHHYVEVALDELVFFVRDGKAIAFGNTADNTAQLNYDTLKLLGYDGATYELYTDDGISPDIENNLKIVKL